MANWLNKTFYDIDYNIAKFFHLLETHGGKPLTWFFEFISILGKSGIVMILISLILYIFPKTRRAGACALICLAISALFTGIIIKPLVARARPYTNKELDFYSWWLNAGAHLEDSNSFPSGHSTASMAFAIGLFSQIKNKKWSYLLFLFPVFMAMSRIYLMVHYFSDCIAGFIVASVSAILAYFIIKLLFDKTKGKFNNFINNFKIQDLFKNNNKNSK